MVSKWLSWTLVSDGAEIRKCSGHGYELQVHLALLPCLLFRILILARLCSRSLINIRIAYLRWRVSFRKITSSIFGSRPRARNNIIIFYISWNFILELVQIYMSGEQIRTWGRSEFGHVAGANSDIENEAWERIRILRTAVPCVPPTLRQVQCVSEQWRKRNCESDNVYERANIIISTRVPIIHYLP